MDEGGKMKSYFVFRDRRLRAFILYPSAFILVLEGYSVNG